MFSWVDPLFWLAEFSADGSAAFERCCPLALLKARSLPKWGPGLEIGYLYENKAISNLDNGGNLAGFVRCIPLFAGNFCTFT